MPETSSIYAYLLAGGASRRMGRDKATMPWRGHTLLEHMASLLSSVYSHVQVVGRSELPDITPGMGPLGGIATALESCPVQRCLVVAIDLPFLTPEFLKLFKMRIETSLRPVIAVGIEPRYPLCLGLDRSLLPLVQRRLADNQLSIRGFVDAAVPELVHEADPSIFANLNSPEDFRVSEKTGL